MHDPRWLSRFHSEERQVPCYRDGRVLLAGDAAHVHSPAGGMGMNTSIQDAANLGWKLAATARGWAPEGLLDSYDAERHPVGREILRTSGAILRVALTCPKGLGPARTLATRAITGIPFVAEHITGALSGLGISYPSPRGAHPLTGKRVPDWQLADGRRLYEALRDGQFLLVGSHPIPDDMTSGYGDRVDTTNTAYPPGIIALIRPDAYIAWAAPWPDGRQRPEIHDALTSWCGSPAQAVPSPRAGLPPFSLSVCRRVLPQRHVQPDHRSVLVRAQVHVVAGLVDEPEAEAPRGLGWPTADQRVGDDAGIANFADNLVIVLPYLQGPR
jgi:hypothetical protein